MAISKIILMYPNFYWKDGWESRTLWTIHPYNIGLLAAMIEDKYYVKIIDAIIDNLTKREFAELIKAEKPDVVGISVLASEYGETGLIAAEIIKGIDPNIKTVLGGVHVTSNPMSVINNQYVDVAVVGEGEYVFKELCDYFNGDGVLPKKGIVYKKDGTIIDTGRADFIEDLDKLPFPAYHKIDFMKYATHIQRESVDRPRDLPYARILTSRGCPVGCCFCAVDNISGKKARVRSPENILSEIEWLIKTYGIKAIQFDDDNLFIFKDRAKKLFQLMIERELNLKWCAIAVAVFKLDEELLGLMKESGCQYINIAIESGVERVLKDIIHKPVKLEYARRMIKRIKELEIDLVVNFIIGFPGETWDEIRQTVKFAEELGCYTKLFIAVPLANTELYRVANEKGYLVKGFDLNNHNWTDGCIETEEFRPQDLKILRAYEWDRINFTEPKKKKKIAEMMGISEERLDTIRKETLIRANP